MNNKNEIVEELKNVSKILLNIKENSKQETIVPENYFENFEQELFKKLDINDSKKTIEKNIFNYLKPIALAASLVGVLVFFIFKIAIPNRFTEDCYDTLACLNTSDIQNYVSENIQDFETEQVYQVFEKNISSTSEIEDEVISIYIEENTSTINELIDNETNYIF